MTETIAGAEGVRERKLAPAALGEVAADGSFSGYASLFGRADLGGDMVMPGAFAGSIARRSAAGIRLLFQHDPGQPLGVWEALREDGQGLFVRGRLMPEIARAREVLSLMRAGALDGLSIGFRTVRSRRDPRSGVRQLLEVDLWEISVVTFPMQPDARISAVKAARAEGRLPTTREFERFLVRDAGLTRSEARTVIVSGFNALAGRRDAAGGFDRLLAARLRRASRIIHPERNA